MAPKFRKSFFANQRALVITAALLLWGWVGLLRGPSLDIPVWNVDETIHATVAEVLLDGGGLYQDAIDQRTPLTYYVTAAVFAVGGSSLTALRILVLSMIALTALAVGAMARRSGGSALGVGAALVFIGLTQGLLYPGDAFAANTEWFVLFFTTAAAWQFLRSESGLPSGRATAITGALLGAAVMSKQSALLELAPPLAALVAIWWAGGQCDFGTWLQRVAVLLGAALGTSLLICLPVLLAGAGPDLWFYAWTYNLQFYGAEFSFAEKLLSGFKVLGLLGSFSIIIALGIGAGAVILAVKSMQLAAPDNKAAIARARDVYLLVWLVVSWGSAAAGGRGFDHYFIPMLAPLALIAGRLPQLLVTHWARRRPQLAAAAAGLTVGLGLWASILAWQARPTPPDGVDPGIPVSTWIAEHSLPDDRIFVWGFNPDIYFYTDRLPASRFIFCIFQTGLIPWTNIDPAIDTSYAVVPGSMETLLADLDRHAPRFFVDSSAGPHRHFGKYPVNKFPELAAWLRTHYVEVEPNRFGRLGFRVFSRIRPAPNDALPFVTAPPSAPPPWILAPPELNPTNASVMVGVSPGSAPITGLGILIGDDRLIATDFVGVEQTAIRIQLPDSIEVATVKLTPVSRSGDGPWHAGDAQTVRVVDSATTPEQARQYALPIVAGQVEATELSAMFGARLDELNGRRQFSMHAPSALTYRLPAEVAAVSGRFGLPPGAYAADNPSPSDGATFAVKVRTGEGKTRELFGATLQPHLRGSDQTEQSFHVKLPAADSTRKLILEITPGPAADATSDWTYWSDVQLETSP
jgi:hypothetical protein